MTDAYFEDSQSIQYSTTPRNLFYCFNNSSLTNDLPILAHWHYYIEILYVTKGYGTIIINGQKFILHNGDLIFIFPRDVHSMDVIDDHVFSYNVIKFDPALLYTSPYDVFVFKNFVPILAPILPAHKYYPRNILSDFKRETIQKILSTYDSKPYGYELIIQSDLLLLYVSFINDLKDHDINIQQLLHHQSDFTSIMPAFEYIHLNYQHPLTAKEVASTCHLSYSYFSRKFKEVSGIPFTKYLNFVRITEAEKLLLDMNMSVTDISYHVGFSDTSYFIQQFKQFKDITPKQFVKLLIRNGDNT